jgi:hypothetical protein
MTIVSRYVRWSKQRESRILKCGIMVDNFIDTTNDGVKVGALAAATAASTAS